MSVSFINILIPAIAGFAGVIAGSLKPLIDWNIEKKRMRLEERKNAIKSLRAVLVNDNTTYWLLVNNLAYSQIRPYLSKKLVAKLEAHPTDPEFTLDSLRWGLAPQLADELHRLEKKWGLL